MAFSVNKGVVSVYLNGVRRFSNGTLSDFFTSRPGIFALGVNYWDLPFNGLIDELKVTRRAFGGGNPRTRYRSPRERSAAGFGGRASRSRRHQRSACRSAHCRAPAPMRSAISWVSPNPAVLSNRGAVTRPGRDQPDVDVTLTATVSLEGQITTRTFQCAGQVAGAAGTDRGLPVRRRSHGSVGIPWSGRQHRQPRARCPVAACRSPAARWVAPSCSTAAPACACRTT